MVLSSSSIIRRLKSVGIHPRRAARKFSLTIKHVEGRLAFAELYAEFNRQWWSTVVFTDEKTFG